MVVGKNGWACWDLAQGSIPGSCTNWRLLVTIFHNLKSFFCFTGTRWDEPQNLWSAILCPCLKVVYVHVIKNLQLTSRRHFKKTHRAFLVFILSLKHVGLNNDLRKEIWIWSTTSQHVFVCLVCLNCCFYLFGAAWQSLDIQALHLLGILLSLRVIHLLLDLLRKIIQILQIQSWSISPLSLLPRCDQSNPLGLPAGKEEINNALFVFW